MSESAQNSESARQVLARELRALYEASGATYTKLADLAGPGSFGQAKLSGWFNAKKPVVPQKKDELEILVKHLLDRTPTENLGEPRDVAWFLRQHALATEEIARRSGGRPPNATLAGKPSHIPVVLPSRPVGFVGRDAQVRDLIDWLDPTAASATAASPAAVVVAGMAGAGKTTLAVHVAHQVKSWYPGGVVCLNLHGYSEQNRMQAEAVAELLLRALGVAAADLPPHQEMRQAWQSHAQRLAEAGQRMLVVLDNVADDNQAWPLLVAPPHRMIITSRRTLANLPARRIHIGPMDADDSALLLHRAVHLVQSDDVRFEAGSPEAALVTRLCGHLPLAVQIVAALLRSEPYRPLSALVEELGDSAERLDVLEYEGSDDQGRPFAVRAALLLSYRHLAPEPAWLFRLLAVNPGADIDTCAAAALIELSHRRTRRLLADLAAAHLLDNDGRDRWSSHDLVRLFAVERAREEEPLADLDAAQFRLVTHQLHRVRDATALLSGNPREEAQFSSTDAAAAWLESERGNLVDLAMSLGSHFPGLATLLSKALGGFFEQRHYIGEWLLISQAAVDDQDDKTQVSSLVRHGQALIAAEQFDEAIEILRKARKGAVDQHDKIAAASGLGSALLQASRVDEAIAVLTEAAATADACGSLDHYAATQNSLGLTLILAKRFDEAMVSFSEAISVFDQLGHQRGLAIARSNYANLLLANGQADTAVETFSTAAAVLEQVEDTHSLGAAAANMATLLVHTDHKQALSLSITAGELLTDRGDTARAVSAWLTSADALVRMGDYDKVVELCPALVTYFRSAGDAKQEQEALQFFAVALRHLDRLEEAIEAASRIVEITDDAERVGALTNLGRDLLNAGRLDEALAAFDEAVGDARDARDARDEIDALTGLGVTHARLGHADEAIERFRSAVEQADHLGDRTRGAVALLNMGSLYTSKPEEAVAMYQQASDLSDDHPQWLATAILTNLATALTAAGRPEEAAAARERAERLRAESDDD